MLYKQKEVLKINNKLAFYDDKMNILSVIKY